MKNTKKTKTDTTFWGIDTEASNSGTEHAKTDIHTIQVCSSQGEDTGKVFYNPSDFKEWLHGTRPRPKILYAFTLPFEYGTLSAWELLHASTEKGAYPWQTWTEEPINLFYIQIEKTRIPIFDIRLFFYQLRYGNSYLTNLKAVSDYLSDYYGMDIHKLPPPLGRDFGKRPPDQEEKPYFERYGKRDAFITAMGAKWIHTNIMQNWLENQIPITRIYSWGTVAKHYFSLPKIAHAHYYGKKAIIQFPNQWHKQIFESTFAGRSEAYCTGDVGKTCYNDVSSLYPTCIIQTQAMTIKDVEPYYKKPDELYGKITWQKFHEETGSPYGWILGDFKTESDLWGLPITIGENNWYVTGTLKNRLYNTLDLQASNAEVMDIQEVLVPNFSHEPEFENPMIKYEKLTAQKLSHHYKSQVEEYAIKSTINATSGILGKSHPNFSANTNIPAYNVMLAQSHLFMSVIFHAYDSPEHPILYTDTDSFFWHKPVEGTIHTCSPYPDMPFKKLESIPLSIGLKGEGDTVIFRGKMYYQNPTSQAFSAWKPFPQYFEQIINEKPTETTIERQITRKWKTRDKNATVLKIGRWFIKREKWDIAKLKQIFRADNKRNRQTFDSYQLFLDGKYCPSKAWTIREATSKLRETPWNVKLYDKL